MEEQETPKLWMEVRFLLETPGNFVLNRDEISRCLKEKFHVKHRTVFTIEGR